MPLAPASASCDPNDIINHTTAFVLSRYLKMRYNMTFGHVIHLVMALASFDANDILHVTTAFASLR